MSMKMSVDAYKGLIESNIHWLHKQPRSYERNHIMSIIKDSTNYYYPENYKKELEQQQQTIQELSEIIEKFIPQLICSTNELHDWFMKGGGKNTPFIINNNKAFIEYAKEALAAQHIKKENPIGESLAKEIHDQGC